MAPMTALSQIRKHLQAKATEVNAAATDEATSKLREELLGHLVDAALDKTKSKESEDGDDSGDASAQPQALNAAVSLGITAIFGFLADAATTHPELCIKPLRLLGEAVAGFTPQQLAKSST